MLPPSAVRDVDHAKAGTESPHGSVLVEFGVILLALAASISAGLILFATYSFLTAPPTSYFPPRPDWAVALALPAAIGSVALVWLIDRRWNRPRLASIAALVIYGLAFAGLLSALDDLCMTCIRLPLLGVEILGRSWLVAASVSPIAFVAMPVMAALSLYVVVGLWTYRPWAWWTFLLFAVMHPLGLGLLLFPVWILLALVARRFLRRTTERRLGASAVPR